MNRRLRAVTGVAGVIAILAGIVLAVDPGYLGELAFVEGIRGAIGGLDPTLLMLLAGVVLLAGSVLSLRRRDGASAPADPFRGASATEAARERERVGGALDRRIEAALAGDAAALADVRERLRRQAALATGGNRDGEHGTLRADHWTDDRLAAAFLGGDSGPDPPISARLRWLVDPVGERRRRVARSIAAIETARKGEG